MWFLLTFTWRLLCVLLPSRMGARDSALMIWLFLSCHPSVHLKQWSRRSREWPAPEWSVLKGGGLFVLSARTPREKSRIKIKIPEACILVPRHRGLAQTERRRDEIAFIRNILNNGRLIDAALLSNPIKNGFTAAFLSNTHEIHSSVGIYAIFIQTHFNPPNVFVSHRTVNKKSDL